MSIHLGPCIAIRFMALSICLLLTGCQAASTPGNALLTSWNEGPSKKAITDFVTKVTTKGSPDYVAPAQRIAVFDNDGTLWAEQPMYFQFLFVVDRIKALAPQHPQWQTHEPFASILRGDVKAALAGGEKALGEMMAVTHSGMTTDEFENVVKDWIATAHHPTLKKPYNECVYQPMVELLAYLRANGFKTYIVSGGGVEFMRPWAEKAYGIPPEQIIGSAGKQKYELRDSGGQTKPVLVKLPELDHYDDKEGKPIAIQRIIGRRPLAAFGNSDGDLQMLEWTSAGDGLRLCVYVHHTDDKREWSYDRTSHIGKLDKGLDLAQAKGWTVVNMKDEWNKVFAGEGVGRAAPGRVG